MMNFSGFFLIGLISSFVGAAIIYILRRLSLEASANKTHADELQIELSEKDKALSAADERAKRIPILEEELKSASDRVMALASDNAKITAELASERKAAQEKLYLMQEAKKNLSDAFKALSAEALSSNNESFIKLANSTLERYVEGAKGDLEKRQQAIDGIIKPIGETLRKLDQNVQEVELKREGAYCALKEQVTSLLDTGMNLRTETSNLVKALRTPKGGGNWGELQLERILENTGMLKYCDFVTQESGQSDKSRQIADVIIRLPAKKNIVIDAKTPMEAYLNVIEAADDNERELRIESLVKRIKKHIEELGKKEYYKQFQPSPEFIVLFLPSEAFYATALTKDPELINRGIDSNVILATPTTLIAMLRAIAYGWKEESLAENAKKISSLGRELHKRIGTVSDYMFDLGKSIEKSVMSYNKTVGSLERNVLSSTRKFKELGAAFDNSEIRELEPVLDTPRQLQADKFDDGEDLDEQ